MKFEPRKYLMRIFVRNQDIAVTAMFDFASKIFSIAISVFVIRILTVEAYANFTYFNSLAIFFSGVIGSGLMLSYVRFYAEGLTRGKDHSSLYLFLIILILIAYAIIAMLVICYVFITKHNVFFSAMAILYGVTLSLISASQSYYQANKAFTKAGILGNIRTFLLLLLMMLLLAYGCHSDLLVVCAYIISGLITAVAGFIFIIKNKHIRFQRDKSAEKAMLIEGFWLILYCLLMNLFNQADILMMRAWDMTNDIAQYGVSFKYYTIALSLLPSIQTVLRVKTADKDMVDSDAAKRNMAVNWLKKSTPLSLAVVILGQVLTKPVFTLLNGSGYGEAIPIFRVLLIGVFISYLTAPNVSLMMANNKQWILCFVAFCALVLNLIGNYLMIPQYGGIAAAITTVVSQSMFNVTCTVILIRKRKAENEAN